MRKTNDGLKLDQAIAEWVENSCYILKAEMTAFSTMPKVRYERKKSQGWLTILTDMKTGVSLTEMGNTGVSLTEMGRRNWFEGRTAGAEFHTFKLIYLTFKGVVR